MDEYESLSHTEMGVQIPRGFHPEMPSQSPVRGASAAPGRGVPASSPSRSRAGLKKAI